MIRLLLFIALASRCFAPVLVNPFVLASTGFTPATYGTVALWGSPRYESGFANNDAVGTLLDFSGNSRTATQSTSSAKPTYKAAGEVSGVSKPVLYCDGGDYVSTASFTTVTQPYTIAVVARAASIASNISPFGDRTTYTGVSARTTGVWAGYAGTLLTGGTATNWTVIVCVFNGASSFMYANGTKTTGNIGTASFANGAVIGAWNAFNERFNGHLGEWCLWSEALTDAEAAAACTALQTDWGL